MSTPAAIPDITDAQQYDDRRLVDMGVRLLTPENTKLFEGAFSLLHCHVSGETFRGVYAILMFPIRHNDRFISLRYTDLDDKEKEIGIIDDLSVFPTEAGQMVRNILVKHYYEHVLTRIHSVEHEFGLLFFDVETEQMGPMKFVMPWRGDRAEDFGTNGKLLLDSFDNRYIIPDLSKLPASDQHEFTNFIYW
ncbi:MAG: DUF1854 domain-containing protein [bacterium]